MFWSWTRGWRSPVLGTFPSHSSWKELRTWVRSDLWRWSSEQNVRGMLTLAALRFILWVSVNDNKKPLCTRSLFAVCFLVPTIITRLHVECPTCACIVLTNILPFLLHHLGIERNKRGAFHHMRLSKGKIFNSLRGAIVECYFSPDLVLSCVSLLVGNGDCLERSGRWHGVFRASSLKQGKYLTSCEVYSLFVLHGSHVVSDGNPLFQSV